MNNIKLKYKFKYNITFDKEFILSDCAQCGKMANIRIGEYDDFGARNHKVNCIIGCSCFSIEERDLIDFDKSMKEIINFIEAFLTKIEECVLEWNMINTNPIKIEYKNKKSLS